MIPPLPRHCGDLARSAQEQVEEALVYIFEINDHEGSTMCGTNAEDPARVLCCRCIARNALIGAGWTLNIREQALESRLGLVGERFSNDSAHSVVHDA